MRTVLTSLVTFLLLGCGVDPNAQKTSTNDTASTQDGNNLVDESLVIEGYVSPINLVVNDKPYADSEDFYTQEVDRLKLDVAKKYPNHDLFFDAAIGLQDFKYGLTAFLVADSEVGVASESAIDSRGKFTFNLPPDTDKQIPYTVRASKRIGLRLVPVDPTDTNVISWCYNLSGETQITLDSKSFILKKFTTNVTSYKCAEKNSSTDINIPDNPYNYVVEAFENADEYHGYGPLPKGKDVPVVKGSAAGSTGSTSTGDTSTGSTEDTSTGTSTSTVVGSTTETK